MPTPTLTLYPTPGPTKRLVTKLTILNPPQKVTIGDEDTVLTVKMEPDVSAALAVKWSSDNEAVAMVLGGKLCAIAPGVAKITVGYDDARDSFEVRVMPPPAIIVPVSSVAIAPKPSTMTMGGSNISLSATVFPVDAVVDVMAWSSSDSGVATVASGVLKAVAPGRTIITVVAGGKTDSFELTVKPAPKYTLKLSQKTLVLTTQKSVTIKAVSYIDGVAMPAKLSWKSKDARIATVASSGKVKAVKTGKTTITVSNEYGAAATLAVSVVDKPAKVKSISISGSPKTLRVGDSRQ